MDNKKEIIAVYADSMEKYNFFLRLHRAAVACGHELIFLTNRLSVKIKGYGDSTEVHLIQPARAASRPAGPVHSREAADGSLTGREVDRLYEAVIGSFENILRKKHITTVFMLGGRNTAELAMRRNAEKHGIKTLYFELANLPGKIFVDPQGTNADSSVYDNAVQLESFHADAEAWDSWISTFLRSKSVQTAPPQAVKKRPLHSSYLLDYLGFRALGIPYENNRPLFQTIRHKLKQKKFQPPIDAYNILEGKYIFFPMQVSNDAQLLFHSGVDNIAAIRHCMAEADRAALDLVVKFHPAEEDPGEFVRVAELRKGRRFFIIDAPSVAIVRHCTKVITINSTVGLEARLMGKPVDFLGKSVFSKLNDTLLKNYILSFLVDIDYFERRPVGADTFRSLLMRAACVPPDGRHEE